VWGSRVIRLDRRTAAEVQAFAGDGGEHHAGGVRRNDASERERGGLVPPGQSAYRTHIPAFRPVEKATMGRSNAAGGSRGSGPQPVALLAAGCLAGLTSAGRQPSMADAPAPDTEQRYKDTTFACTGLGESGDATCSSSATELSNSAAFAGRTVRTQWLRPLRRPLRLSARAGRHPRSTRQALPIPPTNATAHRSDRNCRYPPYAGLENDLPC
jgi:hypothetical protein